MKMVKLVCLSLLLLTYVHDFLDCFKEVDADKPNSNFLQNIAPSTEVFLISLTWSIWSCVYVPGNIYEVNGCPD